MKKELALLSLALILFSFLIPNLVVGATFSNQTCVSNTTLRETNQYYFDISQNTTDNINFTQTKETICNHGCVQTGNVTAECRPEPLNIAVYFIGGVVVLFGAVIIILGYARRH